MQEERKNKDQSAMTIYYHLSTLFATPPYIIQTQSLRIVLNTQLVGSRTPPSRMCDRVGTRAINRQVES
jgi:hypothetical protein